jgi:hypothetical protein
MRVLQRTERADGGHEVVDLTTYEAGSSPEAPPVGGGSPDRGDRWGTVLAFAAGGALAIALILGMWAAAPSPGL